MDWLWSLGLWSLIIGLWWPVSLIAVTLAQELLQLGSDRIMFNRSAVAAQTEPFQGSQSLGSRSIPGLKQPRLCDVTASAVLSRH